MNDTPHFRNSVPRAAIIAAFLAIAASGAAAQATPPSAGAPTGDWAGVERALGKAGTPQPGGVIKFGFPRSDLAVTARGVQLKPALALGSWLAFKHMARGGAMAMGDFVLTEDEVSPVMLRLQARGIEQSALHNHVLGESPRVMYMHVTAHGDAAKLAEAIHSALGASKTPLTAPAAGAAPAAALDLDTAAIASALGRRGAVSGGVYQVSVPRAERIVESGEEIPASMGTATAINFQPTGAGKAAITGDFVMLAAEVNPVIRALREHGIEVTALHTHMLDESPRLFFMHFWANQDAVQSARGLRAALDHMNVKPMEK